MQEPEHQPTTTSGAADGQLPSELALWAAPASAEYGVRTARESGIEFCAAGSDDESTSRHLVETLGTTSFDDVRRGPEDVTLRALLAADPSFDYLQQSRAQRSVFTLEPLVPQGGTVALPTMIGSFLGSAGFRAAQQVLPDFGPIASVHVTSQCGSGQGTLASRLHDAILTLQGLLGSPELLDAMLVATNAAQSNEPARSHVEATPERCSDLTGDLGVLVRFQPRAVGTISASDHATWQRTVHVVGGRGTLDIDEAGVMWRDPSGELIERSAPLENAFELACIQAGAELRSHLEGREAAMMRVDPKETFAACEAVRLSCRTRVPESTEKLRELLERT